MLFRSALLKEVRAAGVPFFRSPERALRAVARLAAWGSAASPSISAVTAPRINIGKRGPIAEYRCKEILARFGVPIPKGRLATSLAEAHVIAKEIGFPVALKAQADALAHKSDVGGVVIGVADDAALDAAEARMSAAVRRSAPQIALEGLLVEAMAPKGGLEMIVGARRDPQWGPVILFGLGGVWTEALKDARLLPADSGRDDILRELARLKGAALLRGMRGAAPRDVSAFADIVEKVGALMRENPEIADIDLNPVNVYAEGEGALALDALFVLS